MANYKMGAPLRPPIKHDNGFLDKFAKHAPTLEDYEALAKAEAYIMGADAVQGLPFVPHNDLPDAIPAFSWFLHGHGQDRTFSYTRYVTLDSSGRKTLESAIKDARAGAEKIFSENFAGKTEGNYQITGGAIACGGDDARYPYPQTENWQKAIGAHMIWISADVSFKTVGGQLEFTMKFTIHAEDRYNFNPGNADIATGLPDSTFGRLETSGLAEQYTNYSTFEQTVRWQGIGTGASAKVVSSGWGR